MIKLPATVARTVYVFSPAGAVRDQAGFSRGLDRLAQLGLQTITDPAVEATCQRFAGDDVTRAQAFSRAAASNANVVLISRGGYGITRLLADLPYAAIEDSIAAGMRWMGYSDFTAFQAALYAQARDKRRALTWAGGALIADFGAEPTPPNTTDSHTISGINDTDLKNTDLNFQSQFLSWLDGCHQTVQWSCVDEQLSQAVEGVLWGGNLSVLSGLIGTPYLPVIKGGILFFEDINEHPYRIERLLTQWLQSGILAQQQAIVIGDMSGYNLTSHDAGFDLSAVLQWLQAQLKIPVIRGLPFGHIRHKTILPFGSLARLTQQVQRLQLSWLV